MHTIIKKIIKKQGQDLITSKILVNCIDDEGGFSDVERRPYKKILKLIIEEGYSRKLLDIGAWNAEAEMLARTCAQRSLIQEEGVLYVFACLAYGLGWLSKAPKVPAEVKKIKQQEAKKKAEEVEAAQKRNEEVIRKNAEEVARKKAEIAEKRAQEAERRAAEAERKAKEIEKAKKKAEQTVKEKADKQAADVVITMIKNIGTIECTEDCVHKVRAALLAYNSLNSAQKNIVDSCIGDTLQRMADETKKIAAGVAQKKAEEAVKRKVIEAARKKAEEAAREMAQQAEKAQQDAHDKEIEAILLAFCKKKGSLLTDNSRDHAEYDMPRNRYDEIYEYVLRKNKEQRNFCISLNGYDYFFYAASNNKSYGISAWRKINSDGLWNINESKKKIDRINKISAIVLILAWFFFLFINARYTWEANSWISAIIWAVITFAVFFGILVLWGKAEEQHPIDPASSGALAHLVWRICWVLGLSIICEIIMMVIFAS